MAYYKVIGGVKYDKALLEEAEKAAADGQVSFAEAKELWENAADGQGVTDIERATLQYVLKTYKFTEKAGAFLRKAMAVKKSGAYYKQINGVKYDRELLELAEKDAADGQISFPEAKALYEKAQDGPGVTDTEARTLNYILKEFKFTDKAAEYLREQLQPKKKAEGYYRTINGVRYDRELLEMTEEFAKDGQVSFPEAKQLWDNALDGQGVTDCEKRTLEYTLKTLKFTAKASEYLQGRIASLGAPPAPPASPKPSAPAPSPMRTPEKRKAMDGDATKQAIPLIDHTSLGDNDTEAGIKALVDAAVAEQPHTAAVCIYPKFIKFVRSLQQSDPKKYPRTLKIATVVNFPSGREPLEKVLADTRQAVADGADEIDMVIDYQGMKEDAVSGAAKAEFQVRQVRRACEDAILKVIIESGELKTPELITAATCAACSGNADFVKTSTGKASVNATPEAAEVMLDMIARWNKMKYMNRLIGFKAAGGIKTAEQAQEYMRLTAKCAFGSEDAVGQVTSKHLRLGSSSLLPVLREALKEGNGAKKQRVN